MTLLQVLLLSMIWSVGCAVTAGVGTFVMREDPGKIPSRNVGCVMFLVVTLWPLIWVYTLLTTTKE